jgi:hypothetical protein
MFLAPSSKFYQELYCGTIKSFQAQWMLLAQNIPSRSHSSELLHHVIDNQGGQIEERSLNLVWRDRPGSGRSGTRNSGNHLGLLPHSCSCLGRGRDTHTCFLRFCKWQTPEGNSMPPQAKSIWENSEQPSLENHSLIWIQRLSSRLWIKVWRCVSSQVTKM